MLLTAERRDVTSSGVLEVARATIKATAHNFDLFTTKIYTNTPAACCRELVANAQDGHTAGNNPNPVEVWLPTEFDPNFRVRDYGIGMSHSFMMTSFLAFGDGSTKNTDNQQIGGMGIGGKSPFGYADQFTIRSVHQGMLSVYSIYKDEEGLPCVATLAQRLTNEANGVEVSFAVDAADFNKFREAAEETLAYFNPRPILHGGKLNEPDYMTHAKDGSWGIRRSSGPIAVIMGGVRYPTNFYDLPYDLRHNDKYSALLNYGIDLTLPIGACSVAASRETLSFDARTTEGLTKGLDACTADIAESFSTMFDTTCLTRWEATKLLSKECSGNHYRAQLLTKHAVFQGEPLERMIVADDMTIWVIDPPRRGGHNIGSANFASYRRNIDPQLIMVIDDLPVEPKSKTMRRLRHAFEGHRNQPIYIVRPKNHADYQDELNRLGNPPREDYILTSELDVPPPEVRVYNGQVRPKVRMFRGSHSTPYGGAVHKTRYGLHLIEEIDYADQPSTGILCVLENFNLTTAWNQAMTSGLFDPEEILFVNKGDAAKLKGFTLLETEIKSRVDDLLTNNPNLPYHAAIRADRNLKEIFDRIRNCREKLTLSPSQQKHPFGRIVDLFDRYYMLEDKRGLHLVTPKYPPRIDTLKLRTAFDKQQSHAAHLLTLTYDFNNSKTLALLQELI